MTHLPKFKDANLSKQYRKNKLKGIIIISISAVILFFIAFLSLYAGSFDINLHELLNSIFTNHSNPESIVIWELRVPRILSSIVVGAALGLSGMLIQTLLQNPLASPSTLGISQGAAFGAAFSIVILGAGNISSSGFLTNDIQNFSINSIYKITFCAFIGSLLASILILLISKLKKMSSQAIILAGVALSSLFMSGTIFIQYFASETELASIVFWTFGDVSRASYKESTLLAILTFIILIYYIITRWNLKAISSGDDNAHTLGINVNRMRMSGMILASIIAATATAFNGVIAFMGLLAPHIAKRIVKNDHRFTALYSCIIGSLLLLIADTIGRIFYQNTSLPVGILTSFLGAPLFLYLLIKGKNYYDRS